MAEIVSRFGSKKKSYLYDKFRIDRKGFLSIMSYALGGVTHRMDNMHRGHAVCVLPIDRKNRKVYLLRNARPNRAFVSFPKLRRMVARIFRDAFVNEPVEVPAEAIWIYGVAAGMIDVDKDTYEPVETPEDAAVRELAEEMGLVVTKDQLTMIHEYHPSIGGSDELITLFFADVGEDVPMVKTHGDDLEVIETLRMDWDEAFGLLHDGSFCSASGIILLQRLESEDLVQKLHIANHVNRLG